MGMCPGGNCWVEKPGYAFKPAYMTRDNSIFCYAVHAVKKGTGITGEKDLAILSAQLKNNVGLFSCNDWEVFSDQPAQLSPTISTRVVPANAEYGKFFRKDKPDHYVNTPLFYEAWKLLKADGRWAAMSWTVKVDAPTVFMPDHLRTILATKKDDQTGVYFQNCKEVLEGFFGNLEVVSAEVSKISDFSLTSTALARVTGRRTRRRTPSLCPLALPVIPKLPSIHSATSNHGSNALAPLPASSTVRSWSERGGCVFFSYRNDRIRQSSLLAGPALSVFV